MVTAEQLASHLQRDLDRASAEQAIAGATGAVVAHCGWGLVRDTVTFVLAGSGQAVLALPTLHLVTVDEVRVNNEVVTDYRHSVRGQLYRAAGWGRWDNVEADCVHGYDPLPDVVTLVVLTMAARIYDNPEQVSSATVGAVSRTFGDVCLTELDTRLLDPYRI